MPNKNNVWTDRPFAGSGADAVAAMAVFLLWAHFVTGMLCACRLVSSSLLQVESYYGCGCRYNLIEQANTLWTSITIENGCYTDRKLFYSLEEME